MKEYNPLKLNYSGKGVFVNNHTIPLSAFPGFTSPEMIKVFDNIEWTDKEKEMLEKIKLEREEYVL